MSKTIITTIALMITLLAPAGAPFGMSEVFADSAAETAPSTHLDAALTVGGFAELGAVEIQLAAQPSMTDSSPDSLPDASKDRRVTASGFDAAYWFVLGLGVFGLLWMRRQAHNL